jgi:hypothetical protein
MNFNKNNRNQRLRAASEVAWAMERQGFRFFAHGKFDDAYGWLNYSDRVPELWFKRRGCEYYVALYDDWDRKITDNTPILCEFWRCLVREGDYKHSQKIFGFTKPLAEAAHWLERLLEARFAHHETDWTTTL